MSDRIDIAQLETLHQKAERPGPTEYGGCTDAANELRDLLPNALPALLRLARACERREWSLSKDGPADKETVVQIATEVRDALKAFDFGEPEIDADKVRRIRQKLIEGIAHVDDSRLPVNVSQRVARNLVVVLNAWLKSFEESLPSADDVYGILGANKPAPGHCSPKPGSECVPPMDRFCTRDVGCKDHPHRWDDGVWRAGPQGDRRSA